MGPGKLAAVLAATLAAAVIAPMPAAATITLDSSASTPTFQQQLNNPCVIGDQSCQEPLNFNATQVSGTPGGGNGSTYDLSSPIYQAGAGVIGNPGTTPDIIPQTFKIGIDMNFATGQGLEQIQFWKTFHCVGTAVTCGSLGAFSLDAANSYQPGSPQNIFNNNNGNGKSDALLNGFSLVAGDFYLFEVMWANDTDGMEEFFIVPGGTAAPVPEPATLMLLGSGLLAAGAFARRRWLGGS
jgi:hypothetical protein